MPKQTLGPYRQNEQIRNTSLYVLYSCSPKGTELARTKGWLPELTRQMNEGMNPLSTCQLPFIFPVHLCKQYNSDVMIWCHDHLLPCLGRKSLCACTVESCWLTCTYADVPNLSPHLSLHELIYKFCIPIPIALTLSPRYFGVPSYQSL